MNPPRKKDAATLPFVHGALNTRKSTQEGLEQEFHALDAHRQSAQAFLRNQAHQGRIARLMTLDTVQVLALTAGKDTTFYQLQALQSDFGAAYRLTKAERGNGPPESYDVCLRAGGRSTCECKGHLRWGTQCKHIASLFQLHKRGLLPVPAPKSPPAPQTVERDDL
jgi:hypothetical protein